MAGRYPGPDAQRRHRNALEFGWVALPPAGRKGKAPALPSFRPWQKATREWWRDMWRTPQAVMWDPSGRSLHSAAILVDELAIGERAPAPLIAELRQQETMHGLSPKALLQLRWLIVDESKLEARLRPPPDDEVARRREDRRHRIEEGAG